MSSYLFFICSSRVVEDGLPPSSQWTSTNIWNQGVNQQRTGCFYGSLGEYFQFSIFLSPRQNAEGASTWVYSPEYQAGGRRGSCSSAVTGSAALYGVWAFLFRRRVESACGEDRRQHSCCHFLVSSTSFASPVLLRIFLLDLCASLCSQ